MRIERGARHSEGRFGIERRHARKRPGAGQPVLGRVAMAHAQIGRGEIGMGRLSVSGLEHAAGAAKIAGLRCQPAADRRRGDKRRRELASLLRQSERDFRIALHRFLGHRRLDHGAPAVRGRLVDEPGAGVRVDGRQRAGPIAAPRAIVEHRLTGPGCGGARMGAHRILQGRGMIAGAPRLDMQAAQANAMRFVMLQHRIIGRDGPRSVPGKLRGLGLQELGHRLVPDQPVRVVGVLGGASRVACADGQHPARQSLEPLLAPTRPRADRNQRRDTEDEAQHAPHDRERQRQRQDGAEREQQRNLVLLAPPGDVHDARIVRKPRQTPGDQRQRRQENQQANHRDPASKRQSAPHGAWTPGR